MKIVWFVNIVMPEVARELGLWETSLGGWLTGQLNGLRNTGNELTVINVAKEVDVLTKTTIKGVDYFLIPYENTNSIKREIKRILDEIDPNVIHIFGTETETSNLAFEVSDINKTVLSIQGLVSQCAHHISDGIPDKYYKSTLPKRLAKRFLRGSVIEDDSIRLHNRGIIEIEMIKNAKYVIGRTTWDKNNVLSINPSAVYYKCNEILRGSFYEADWDIDKCDKYSIFLSQSSSPIKGLHQMLKAMPLIMQEYPQTQLYVAGYPLSNFIHRNVLKQLAVEYFCGYQGYIENLVRKYDLYDRIHFLNYLNEEQMRNQFLKSHVFVLPSSIENSPNSLGEAMLLGVPCVASNVGGVPDMMHSPEEGFIYRFDDPKELSERVCSIFGSKSLAAKISQNARKHAHVTHSIKKNTTALLETYEQIGGRGV